MQLIFEHFIRFSIWLVAHSFYRPHVSGEENIPQSGAAILVCNHVSFVDWLFISASLNRPVRFVIDQAYFRGIILKPSLAALRVIPIAGPREDPRILEEAYRKVAAELARGELVCIFPEGCVTRNGKLGEFKPGVMKILKENQVPVIPLQLSGLWGSIFSYAGGLPLKKRPRRFRARIGLRIGKPISPGSITLAGLKEKVAALKNPSEPPESLVQRA